MSLKPVYIGGLVVGALVFICALLPFEIVNAAVGLIGSTVGVLLVIVFQQECRQALDKIGRFFISVMNHRQDFRGDHTVLLDAVTALSRLKKGALLVLIRDHDIQSLVRGGVAIDALMSVDLILALFNESSPTHDGAVLIKDGRILSSQCFLPLSESEWDISLLGTRHSAALGLSEASDAIIIVISEETGQLSVAESGQLKRDVDVSYLKTFLEAKLNG